MMYFGRQGIVEEYPPDIWANGSVGLIWIIRGTVSQPIFPIGFGCRIFLAVNKTEEIDLNFHRHHLLTRSYITQPPIV